MFAKLKQRWQDMRTIADLSKDAERRALQAGQQHPGAEHYALAALDLADGSARRVFQRIGADPEAYRAALANRHVEALSAMGLDVAGAGEPPAPAAPGKLFDAQPSGQVLMQTLPEVQRRLPAPLCGAHILLAVAGMRLSAAGRAFGAINVDPQALGRAAEEELRAMLA
ncbi:Clp protease N-terminal domain-containing protein [Duganella sp. HH105]|uniref:Clp protease N-terminal domain-containing protein n=1 Tax=Duganella sp. HH105 TaxID=1781067 RepID=UPI000877B1FD|nr:Clp protease N-terminal domain-containing protein [Duganella sp. HH105]OEZ64037.1 Clp amino terminal domain protein [Duganella sp. HH105]